MRLRSNTPLEWVQTVQKDMNSFLQDHAACERKASANGLSLVSHYPNRKELVKAMIEFSVEELDHYRQVYEKMEERGVVIAPDIKDEYVSRLLKQMRSGPEAYFLDRLLVAGVIEARGCERFGLLSIHLESGPLKDFYREITRAEAQHHLLFVKLAKHYFPADEVEKRLDELLDFEGEMVQTLPFRAAVH
ncbi:MAG: tRNA-(ms[2]io[6]A)-hydroxylase [Deltaproteobacteria bacterium]|nr:tRNA-(ms[2]io[6]A)-hydroxylase [Deltaproteobacteria bacterium]